jgi:hypothetical protein
MNLCYTFAVDATPTPRKPLNHWSKRGPWPETDDDTRAWLAGNPFALAIYDRERAAGVDVPTACLRAVTLPQPLLSQEE